jgi:hypothetical protein
VQLFCRDRAHGEKVTPQKCHRKIESSAIKSKSACTRAVRWNWAWPFVLW